MTKPAHSEDRNGVGFADACAEAAMMPDFVKQYNRITKNNLQFGGPQTVIESMIDRATGYSGIDETEAHKFADFFYEYVWSRLPDNCFHSEVRDDK